MHENKLVNLNNSKAKTNVKKKVRATDKAKSMHGGDKPIRAVVYHRLNPNSFQWYTRLELLKYHYKTYINKTLGAKFIAIYLDGYDRERSIEKQPGLKQLLEDAKGGKFDVIIIKDITYLCRRLIDCMIVIDGLRNLSKPVGVIFESDNLYTLDQSDYSVLKAIMDSIEPQKTVCERCL